MDSTNNKIYCYLFVLNPTKLNWRLAVLDKSFKLPIIIQRTIQHVAKLSKGFKHMEIMSDYNSELSVLIRVAYM